MKFRCENCGEAFYHHIETYDQIAKTFCPWCKSFVVVKCYRCGRDVQQILWKNYGGFCISCFDFLAPLSHEKIAEVKSAMCARGHSRDFQKKIVANNEAYRRECQVEQAKIDAYNDANNSKQDCFE